MNTFRVVGAAAALTATAALLLATSGCGAGSESGGNGRLNVVASVSPITSLVENIGGTKIDLQGLIPEGRDSDTYELPPSDVKALSSADLIVLNGLGLEDAILDLANANKKDSAAVLLLGEQAITTDNYVYDSSFPKEQGKPNPHIWMNPVYAMKYAELIHDKLVDIDSANKDYYDANWVELKTRLERLDQSIRTSINSIPPQDRKLLTYHDSFAYFAEHYRMTVIDAIQPTDFSKPSANEVANLIEQIKREKVPAIFGSEVFPGPVLEQIASESGAKLVDKLRDDDLPGAPGDALHSYMGLLVEDLRAMVPALDGDAAPMQIVKTGLVFSDGPSPAEYPQLGRPMLRP